MKLPASSGPAPLKFALPSSLRLMDYARARPRVLTFLGIFVPIVFVFFGSRWLGQVRVGPVYFYDIGLVISALCSIFLTLRYRKHRLLPWRWAIAFGVLCLWALVRLNMPITENALRDLYPFAVVTWAALLAVAVQTADPTIIKTGLRLSFVSLWAHWLWTTLHGLGLITLGESWLTPVTHRPDVDGALVAVLGAAILYRESRATEIPRRIAGMAIAFLMLYQVSTMPSRASFIGAVVTYLLVSAIIISSSGQRRANVTVLLLLSLATVSAVSQTPMSKRLEDIGIAISSFSESPASPEHGPNTSDTKDVGPPSPNTEASPKVDATRVKPTTGTAGSRLKAWTAVFQFGTENSTRLFFGSGPGSEYMWDSGGTKILIGESATPERTRHAHNFILHVYALLGLPASLLVVVLGGAVFWLALRTLWKSPTMLGVLAFCVLVSFAIVSFFGVVMEGPHGIIPFSWAIGVLLGLAADPRKWCCSEPRAKTNKDSGSDKANLPSV